MKNFVVFIFKCIGDWLLFAFFMFRGLVRFYRCCWSFPRETGNVCLLANGPSLKEHFEDIKARRGFFADSTLMCVNWFCNNPLFFEIKPRYLVLADPAYCTPEKLVPGRYEAMCQNLDRVDWPLTLILPHSFRHQFRPTDNPIVTYFYVNCMEYLGPQCLRNWAYKRNFAIPRVQNVTNLAIYFAIQAHFSKIYLYGVDHTFFDGLCVNSDNILCKRDSHFYGKEEIKPFIKLWTEPEPFRMSVYVRCIADMFASHDLLADFARYCGDVEIINCTKCSLIDSYKRLRDDDAREG